MVQRSTMAFCFFLSKVIPLELTGGVLRNFQMWGIDKKGILRRGKYKPGKNTYLTS